MHRHLAAMVALLVFTVIGIIFFYFDLYSIELKTLVSILVFFWLNDVHGISDVVNYLLPQRAQAKSISFLVTASALTLSRRSESTGLMFSRMSPATMM